MVTRVANRSSPGWASAVKAMFKEVDQLVMDSPSLISAARVVGVCAGKGWWGLLPKAFATN
jgi:hypothetical protein